MSDAIPYLPVEIKRIIYQHFVQANEAMTTKLENTAMGLTLRTYRPISANQLRCVDHATRDIFDDVARCYQTYQLRVSGFEDLDAVRGKWEELIPLKHIRALRLIVDLTNDTVIEEDTEVPECALVKLISLIKHFVELQHIEIFFLVRYKHDRSRWTGTRGQLTLKFPRRIQGIPTIWSIRVSTIRMYSQADWRSCPTLFGGMSTLRRIKTERGWRTKTVDNCVQPIDCIGDAHKLRMQIKDGQSVIVPLSDRSEDLIGYRIHGTTTWSDTVTTYRKARDGSFIHVQSVAAHTAARKAEFAIARLSSLQDPPAE